MCCEGMILCFQRLSRSPIQTKATSVGYQCVIKVTEVKRSCCIPVMTEQDISSMSLTGDYKSEIKTFASVI